MLMVTTETIQGVEITKILGLVQGSTVQGINCFHDIAAGLRSIFGGRAKGYSSALNEACEEAQDDMKNMARGIGANAIIGVKMSISSMSEKNTMLAVSYCGTAVRANL